MGEADVPVVMPISSKFPSYKWRISRSTSSLGSDDRTPDTSCEASSGPYLIFMPKVSKERFCHHAALFQSLRTYNRDCNCNYQASQISFIHHAAHFGPTIIPRIPSNYTRLGVNSVDEEEKHNSKENRARDIKTQHVAFRISKIRLKSIRRWSKWSLCQLLRSELRCRRRHYPVKLKIESREYVREDFEPTMVFRMIEGREEFG